MKCPFCMEDIADNSEKCSLCNSDIVKPCPYCMEKILADALKCKHCGSMLNSAQPQPTPQQPQYQQPATQLLPAGVVGWSWGAFLLNWIWAIGNRTWLGLLALIPVVGIIMAVILGFKGREWAWKSKQWESVEHFNRVQKKWSQWAVGLVGGCTLLAVMLVTPLYFKSDPGGKKFMWQYAKCVSTKDENSCRVLVETISNEMPYDTAKINLDKLCIKYGIEQACIDPPMPGSAKADQIQQAVQQNANANIDASNVIDTRSGQLSVVKQENEIEVKLNGKFLYMDDGAYNISLEKKFQTSTGEAVLVFENSGGTACPGLYRFITIPVNGAASVTKAFGNCSDIPEITQKGDVITLKFPKNGGAEAEKVVYEKGNVSAGQGTNENIDATKTNTNLRKVVCTGKLHTGSYDSAAIPG